MHDTITESELTKAVKIYRREGVEVNIITGDDAWAAADENTPESEDTTFNHGLRMMLRAKFVEGYLAALMREKNEQ